MKDLDYSALDNRPKKWKTIIKPGFYTLLFFVAYFIFRLNLSSNENFSRNFYLGVFIVIIVILVLFGLDKQQSLDKSSYKRFAEKNGLSIKKIYTGLVYQSFLYYHGTKQRQSGYISGQSNGLHYQIFTNSFNKYYNQNGSSKDVFVLQIELGKDFPHIFIDSKLNDDYLKDALKNRFYDYQHLKLNQEFSKQFRVFVPNDYEIEGLDIISLDVMSMMLEYGKEFDVEIIDGFMLIYLPRHDGMSVQMGYQSLFEKLEAISPILSTKLSTWQFTKIPNTPHKLNDSNALRMNIASRVGGFFGKSLWLVAIAVFALVIYIGYLVYVGFVDVF